MYCLRLRRLVLIFVNPLYRRALRLRRTRIFIMIYRIQAIYRNMKVILC
ncbi:TPA: hypothetical protein WH934_001528 [Neisseria meningitidis]